MCPNVKAKAGTGELEHGCRGRQNQTELGKDGIATETDTSEKLILAEIRKQEETQTIGLMVQMPGRQAAMEATGLAANWLAVKHKQHRRS